MVELAPMRQAYADALVALGHADQRVVALSADVQTSDFSAAFGQAFPDRYFNVGIAEQALVDVAVGLALAGRIPFANTFAVFLASRALEPVLTHLAYGRANVKLMAGYCGLSPQTEGPTHHAITDVAVMRSLPGMAVVAPSDPAGMAALLPQVAEWPGPVYYRFNRNEVPVLFGADYAPRIGDAIELRQGKDVLLVANGIMVSRSLAAADELGAQGISAGVLEVHTIKPLDTPRVLDLASSYGAVVTAEEHTVIGGLGAAVAEALTDAGVSAVVKRVGVRDRFASSAPYFQLLDASGLGVADVVAAAVDALATRARTGSSVTTA
jgi:transketolase